MTEERRGTLYGLAAYLMWGSFPLFFPLLKPATPIEILAHRVLWTLVFMVLLLVVLRRWSWVVAIVRDRGRLVCGTCRPCCWRRLRRSVFMLPTRGDRNRSIS